jgi:hypothetical protein
MLLILALICFILAVKIGSWRHKCALLELHMPYECPRIWLNKFVKNFTLILSVLFSIIFASLLTDFTMDIINSIFGKLNSWVDILFFCLLLYSRMLISEFFGNKSLELNDDYISNKDIFDKL